MELDEGEFMKLGLDVHGVLDANPKDFVTIAKYVRSIGGEVHIITGSSYDENLKQLLLSFNNNCIFWDYIVSIQDELIKRKEPEGINIYGRPYWKDETWDRIKGEYCARNMIDIHYDDTERYSEYFTTPFILYKKSTQYYPTNDNCTKM